MDEWRGNKRNTENDVIGMDDEGRLQLVEGESRITQRMATFHVWTRLRRQKTKRRRGRSTDNHVHIVIKVTMEGPKDW